jgi:hypothetical protein
VNLSIIFCLTVYNFKRAYKTGHSFCHIRNIKSIENLMIGQTWPYRGDSMSF